MISILAPAKLTLTLRITGVRDDGYHELDAEMVTLDLADALTIDPDGDGVTVGGPFGDGVPVDDGNLVAGALRLAGRRAGVHVDKRIPHGGGLGGGSADAAAVLRWAGFDDLAAASRLGADIPFCMVGGRAFVAGHRRGRRADVVPAARGDARRSRPCTSARPTCTGRGTPSAARAPTVPTTSNRPRSSVEPALAHWRDRIEELSGVVPVLAGSGATWFLPGRRDDVLAALRAEGATVDRGPHGAGDRRGSLPGRMGSLIKKRRKRMRKKKHKKMLRRTRHQRRK